MSRKKAVFRSMQEKQAIVAAIDADIAKGMSIPEAVVKHEIAKARYYSWKKELGMQATPKILEYDGSRPVKEKKPKGKSKSFIVFGSPEELAAFAREMQ